MRRAQGGKKIKKGKGRLGFVLRGVERAVKRGEPPLVWGGRERGRGGRRGGSVYPLSPWGFVGGSPALCLAWPCGVKGKGTGKGKEWKGLPQPHNLSPVAPPSPRPPEAAPFSFRLRSHPHLPSFWALFVFPFFSLSFFYFFFFYRASVTNANTCRSQRVKPCRISVASATLPRSNPVVIPLPAHPRRLWLLFKGSKWDR